MMISIHFDKTALMILRQRNDKFFISLNLFFYHRLFFQVIAEDLPELHDGALTDFNLYESLK